MAAIKGTVFFTQTNPFGQVTGWSESHMVLDANDLPSALTSFGELVRARSRLLGCGVIIPYVRVSLVGLRNDSKVDRGPDPLDTDPPVYNRAFDQQWADISGAGVLVRVEAVDPQYIARRSMFLKGNPDKANRTDKPVTADAAWNSAWRTFKALLESGRYGMMAADRSGSNPVYNVTNVDATSPYAVTIGAHTLAVGNLVRVSGIRGEDAGPPVVQRRLNGVFQLSAVTGTTITLLGSQGVGTYTGGGTVRKYTKVPLAYSLAEIRRYGIRRTGRPFDLASGRRPIPAT